MPLLAWPLGSEHLPGVVSPHPRLLPAGNLPRSGGMVGVSVLGINGLAAPENPVLAADVLLSVFHRLYADSWGPRANDILHASLLTLARRGDASLAMVPLLLSNPGFRRSITGREAKADPVGLGTFWAWYEGLSDAERQHAIAPLMNKLRTVLLRPGLRGVVGQRQPRFHLRQAFTTNTILLVNLSRGELGSEAAQLLGSLAVALVWDEARRSRLPASQRHPVFVTIDEAQDYLALGDVGEALTQSRSLGVGFALGFESRPTTSPRTPPGIRPN